MPGLQLNLFWNTQIFSVASGAVAIIDKDVASGFKEWEQMNGFKTCIRKVESNAEKAWCKFWRCETRAHHSDLNSHYASN